MSTSTEHRGAATSITRRAILGALAATLPLSGASVSVATVLPKLLVSKDPTCGCCGSWVDHVRSEGFEAEVVETSQINRVKARLGVPPNLHSCHTAEIGGYVVEGHVPASTMKRLISERPRIRGLAVAGMPVGSPGMEVDGAAPETFDVIAFTGDRQSVFARFRGHEPL